MTGCFEALRWKMIHETEHFLQSQLKQRGQDAVPPLGWPPPGCPRTPSYVVRGPAAHLGAAVTTSPWTPVSRSCRPFA
jgi:hypothetical protein